MYRIGIDVGGTFTDLAAVDEFGRATLAKVPSTPADPTEGVLDGLNLLAEMLGLEPPALLAETDRIVHGTTVATNALIEHKGARVGLLTTAGHRDVIEMREGLKDDRYNLRLPPPEQLVPRKLRLGVRERLRADGRIETPLDRASLDCAIAVLKRAQVEAVAVCYLHSWRDPTHERVTREAVDRELPGAYVSLSFRSAVSRLSASAPAEDRSLGSIAVGSCMSARRARARFRAPPATASEAALRPSPTPIWCSATLIRGIFSVGGANSTARLRRGPSTRSRARSASTG